MRGSFMGQIIRIGMADLNVCASPDGITTLGLGSCVGIAIRDPVTKIGGLAHIMLPDSHEIRNNDNIPKFADTGIEELVRLIVEKGAARTRLVEQRSGAGYSASGRKTSAAASNQIGARREKQRHPASTRR